MQGRKHFVEMRYDEFFGLNCTVYLLRHMLYILRDRKKEDSLLDEPYTDNDGSSVDSSNSLVLDRATSVEKFLSMAYQSLSKAYQSGAQMQTVAKEIVWFSYSVSYALVSLSTSTPSLIQRKKKERKEREC